MLDFLQTVPDVLNWFAWGEAGIFIVSNILPTQLAAVIHNKFPSLYFAVVEGDTNAFDGWLPQAVWDFVRSPKAVEPPKK